MSGMRLRVRLCPSLLGTIGGTASQVVWGCKNPGAISVQQLLKQLLERFAPGSAIPPEKLRLLWCDYPLPADSLVDEVLRDGDEVVVDAESVASTTTMAFMSAGHHQQLQTALPPPAAGLQLPPQAAGMVTAGAMGAMDEAAASQFTAATGAVAAGCAGGGAERGLGAPLSDLATRLLPSSSSSECTAAPQLSQLDVRHAQEALALQHMLQQQHDAMGNSLGGTAADFPVAMASLLATHPALLPPAPPLQLQLHSMGLAQAIQAQQHQQQQQAAGPHAMIMMMQQQPQQGMQQQASLTTADVLHVLGGMPLFKPQLGELGAGQPGSASQLQPSLPLGASQLQQYGFDIPHQVKQDPSFAQLPTSMDVDGAATGNAALKRSKAARSGCGATPGDAGRAEEELDSSPGADTEAKRQRSCQGLRAGPRFSLDGAADGGPRRAELQPRLSTGNLRVVSNNPQPFASAFSSAAALKASGADVRPPRRSMPGGLATDVSMKQSSSSDLGLPQWGATGVRSGTMAAEGDGRPPLSPSMSRLASSELRLVQLADIAAMLQDTRKDGGGRGQVPAQALVPGPGQSAQPQPAQQPSLSNGRQQAAVLLPGASAPAGASTAAPSRKGTAACGGALVDALARCTTDAAGAAELPSGEPASCHSSHSHDSGSSLSAAQGNGGHLPGGTSQSGVSLSPFQKLRAADKVKQPGKPLAPLALQGAPSNTPSGEQHPEDGLDPGAAQRGEGFSRKVASITRERLQEVYHLNIEEAARELGIGMTKLKEHCRTLGIARWPARKLKSMDKLIESLQERAASEPSWDTELVADVCKQIQEFKRQIYENPCLEVEEEIKRLRQSQFKKEYQIRQATRATTGAPGPTRNGSGGGADMAMEGPEELLPPGAVAPAMLPQILPGLPAGADAQALAAALFHHHQSAVLQGLAGQLT